MQRTDARPAVMLCVTGLHIPGGMASLNRTISAVFDKELGHERLRRLDHVLLHADTKTANKDVALGSVRVADGNKLRFVSDAWRLARRHRHEWTLFDLLGMARAATLPLPGFPPGRLAIFTHYIELTMRMTPRHLAALRKADLILANSHFSAGELRKWKPELAERVRGVPLCIDPVRVSEWDALELEDRPREPIVLIVSRLNTAERGKGHNALIDAWPGVLAEHPDAELWIVGDGDDRSRLEQKVQAAGIAAAVKFTGPLDTAELHEVYSRASVYAMPSRQEGFGIVYAEAMWHELPCIGSNADAASEVIVDDETGLIVNYDDADATGAAVRRLLGNPDLARRLGRAGRTRVLQEYTFDAFAERLLDALELRA